jgi:hypothetical protein
LRSTDDELHTPTFEYPLPKEVYQDGVLDFAWTCGAGQRGSQVADLWIMNIDDLYQTHSFYRCSSIFFRQSLNYTLEVSRDMTSFLNP